MLLAEGGQEGPAILLTLYDLDGHRRREIDAEAELYMRDGIGEWRRVQRVFQNIERESQLILQAAGEGIYGIDAEGKTTFVNPAAERILGWSAEDLLGQNVHAIVHHHRPDGTHYPEEDCPIYMAFREGASGGCPTRCSGGAMAGRSGSSTPARRSAVARGSSERSWCSVT